MMIIKIMTIEGYFLVGISYFHLCHDDDGDIREFSWRGKKEEEDNRFILSKTV